MSKRTAGFVIMAAVMILAAHSLWAYSYRVNQLPNGDVSSCANCHINASGGGARNDFGALVANKYLSGGNVVWGEALAREDADKDTFSNGRELQDPDGAWKIGDAAPGDRSLVTNPGDAASKPSETGINHFLAAAVPEQIQLHQNYPNPFNPETRIRFELDRPAQLAVRIFNLQGHLVRTLVQDIFTAGSYEVVWNGRDEAGNTLGSGIYLCQLQSGGGALTVRMVLMK